MIGRLRQLSEPRLRQQAGIEKSKTPVERDILVQWVRNHNISVILNSDAHFRQSNIYQMLHYCSLTDERQLLYFSAPVKKGYLE